MKKHVSIITMLLPFLLAGCENHSEGVRTSIRFMASFNENRTGMTTKSSSAEGILIDSATISLQDIKLLQQNSTGQISASANTLFPGPYLIDLVSHKSVPAIVSSSITPGTYSGINGKLYVPQKTGYSVYVSGTYTLDNKWWKFYYTNSGSLTFQVVDSLGFIVDIANPEIWVMIDVVSFFKGVDFSKATVENNNIIRINGTSNPSLSAAIQNNFTIAASVSSVPPDSKTNSSSSGGSSGNNSGGSSGAGNGSGGNSNSAGQGSSGNSGSSGTVTNSGGNSNQDKEKNKNKEKDQDKNKSKSKHDQKDNNKSKDKSKDKNENGH